MILQKVKNDPNYLTDRTNFNVDFDRKWYYVFYLGVQLYISRSSDIDPYIWVINKNPNNPKENNVKLNDLPEELYLYIQKIMTLFPEVFKTKLRLAKEYLNKMKIEQKEKLRKDLLNNWKPFLEA